MPCAELLLKASPRVALPRLVFARLIKAVFHLAGVGVYRPKEGINIAADVLILNLLTG